VRRLAALVGVMGACAAVFASLDLQPSLKRLDVTLLSGTPGGQYHEIAGQLAAEAARDRGRIGIVATNGSVENLQRLAAARDGCTAHYGLAQDGLDVPQGLSLIGRLPRSESVFFLARDAASVRTLQDLKGRRIGVGPVGSGTDGVAREILESPYLQGLGATLSNHALDEQLAMVGAGQLDLAVMVVDEDAPRVVAAVRDAHLDIVSLPQADVIARRLRHVRTGRIGAGQYDPIALRPATDRTVLRIDTLVLSNGCTRKSADAAMLTVLARTFPDFVRRNTDGANATGVPLDESARRFFEEGGPDLASQHVPWAVDIMPLSNWIYAITAISLLFNAMGMWNKFLLWRLDARRVQIEEQVQAAFGATLTPREIADLVPTPVHLTDEHRASVAALVAATEDLRAVCRKHSMGWAPDMGEELPYRYQEQLMGELLRALRRFDARVTAARDGEHEAQEPSGFAL
jgi:TRAP-type uncharacterized transport system substrate-binding protein